MDSSNENAAPGDASAANATQETLHVSDNIPLRLFFKAVRSPEVLELIQLNPLAFTLLFIIAYRTWRTTDWNRHNLKIGEAFIGDHHECGMTEQNYRTAKIILSKAGFATFNPTNKGTIARLTDSRIFDVNLESPNGQLNRRLTDGQRTANGRVTTNNKLKNDKKGENTPPTLTTTEKISRERELERIVEELKGYRRLNDYPMGSAKYKRVLELTTRQKQLRCELGVVT
jgi:hypothetical protein